MKKAVSRGNVLICIGFGLFLVTAGCSNLGLQKNNSGSAATSYADKGQTSLYLDFGDVLIPSELKVDRDDSFVYKTPGFSAGVLSLEGRVDPASLIAFFETYMVKDNWQPVASFKSPRSFLMFRKENRWCVINITEKTIYTYVQIWVAPTIEGSETTLSK